MKRILALIFSIVAVLTSCQKEDLNSSNNAQYDSVEIKVAAEVDTRATTSAPTRYIMEVYSDEACSEGVNMFEDESTNQITTTNGVFSLILDRTKEYYFLFWSDVNGEDVYTTENLKEISLKSAKNAVESWSGQLNVPVGTTAAFGVTLTRSVAKLNLLETGSIVAGGSLNFSLLQPDGFNVATGASSETKTLRNEQMTVVEAIYGSETAPVQINMADYYFFAPKSGEDESDVVFNKDTIEEFTVLDVAFQANRTTNVVGHYSVY